MTDPTRRTVLKAFAAGTAALAVACVGCSAGPGSTRTVPLAAGPLRSVYHAWSSALAAELATHHPELLLEVLVTSGSVDNLRRLGDASAVLAVASADAAAQALSGRTPFEVAVPLAALARVYDDYVHLVVRDDGGWKSLRDLTGRPVAVGSPGSGTSLVAHRVLDAAQVSVEAVPLDLVEAGLALQGRRVDALFWLGGLPTRGVLELAQRVRVRLLPLGELAAVMRSRHGAAYRSASIPSRTYLRPEGTPTIAAANLLLCRPDAAPAVVATVLATAFDRRDAIAAAAPAGGGLDRRAAIATQPIPLHTKAIRFYRDRKP